MVEPQPAPDDPIWGGRDAVENELVRCYFAGGNGPDGLPWVEYFRSTSGPDEGPPIDPAFLAQTAFEQIAINPVSVGLAPEPGADSLGLVGLPIWMWVDNPSTETFGPATLSVSAGTVSVSLRAEVTHVDWNMGDGNVVRCTSPGTPYQPAFGTQSSPDCGHRYDATSADSSGGAFTVTATSFWVAEWTATTGDSGTIEVQREASEQVRIGESQVIVTRD